MTMLLTAALSAGFRLRKLAETATTVTVGWDPVPADGFRFTNPAGKRSHTWDGSRTDVRFSKGPGVCVVEPLVFTDRATWP